MQLGVFALATVLAPLLGAQDGPWVRPRPIDDAALGVVRIAPQGGPSDRIVALDFPIGVLGTTSAERMPLARPVGDVEIGLLLDGSICVLAGGVREELDVYHFDPVTQSAPRLVASAGRRLPARFCGGLGSWPLFADRGFCMFAYEKDERVEFRATAAGGRSLASRTLPLDCEGFVARFDDRAYLVRVAFVASGARELDRLEFMTPDAPRLVVDGARSGVISFGDVDLGATARRATILRNAGASPLPLELSIEGPFVLEDGTPAAFELAPEGVRNVVVAFTPATAVPVVGRLLLRTPVAGASTEFALRGTGVEATRAAPSPPAAIVPTPGHVDPVPLPEPSVGFDVENVDVDWRAPGTALVDLSLRAPGPFPPQLVLVNARTGAAAELSIDRSGRASAAIAALPLDPLELAGDGAGSARPLCAAPPALRLAGDSLLVLGPPRTPFLLVQVAHDPLRLRLMPGASRWQGRTDARGSARVGTALVGSGPDAVHLVLVVPSADGSMVVSAPIEIGPSTPPSGRDRAK